MCENVVSPSMPCAVSPDILRSPEPFPSILTQGLRTGWEALLVLYFILQGFLLCLKDNKVAPCQISIIIILGTKMAFPSLSALTTESHRLPPTSNFLKGLCENSSFIQAGKSCCFQPFLVRGWHCQCCWHGWVQGALSFAAAVMGSSGG